MAAMWQVKVVGIQVVEKEREVTMRTMGKRDNTSVTGMRMSNKEAAIELHHNHK